MILESDAGGDLILKVEGTADSLTVRDDFSYQKGGVISQISGIRFTDGSSVELPTYSQNEPVDFTWQGSTTELALSGSNYGNNTFDLAPGGDYVTFGNTTDGGPGSNTVLFDKGDGDAVVNLNGGTGEIILAADITSSDVILQADSAGDLTIELLDTGESLTVDKDLAASGNYGPIGVQSGISEVRFADGSRIAFSPSDGANKPLDFTWIGSATDHTLVGSSLGSNTFTPGADGDSVTFGSSDQVGAASNVLNYARGNGAVTLNLNNGNGTIDLGAGITRGNVTFQSDDSTGNLTILDGTAGDSIVVNNDLYNYYGTTSHLGTLTFADGSTFNLNQPLTFTWSATAADTTLAGSDYGANVFNLVAGSDSVTFGNGSLGGSNWNAVNYAAGDGALTVNMNGGVGTIDLGTGITQSDLTFQSDDSTGNLTILDGTAGDSIVVNNDLYNYYGTTSHLGELTFSDGSTFNLNQPLTFTWSATAADTTLAGSDYGANVFNLVAGSDSVTFGNGSLGGSNWNAVNYVSGDDAHSRST